MTEDPPPVSWLIGSLAALAGLIVALVAAVLWMTAVPGRSHDGPLPALTEAEADLVPHLRGHVEAIASEPHNTAHPEALRAAAAYIERTLTDLGYAPESQRYTADGVEVRNIEVVIAPADPGAETYVIGSHYDSFADAPGANDNGTGVAALIEMARALRDLDGRAGARLRLVFFANEEPPYTRTELMGSLVYARALAESGETVAGMWALETMGHFDDRPGSQLYPFPLGLLYPDTGNFIAFVGMVPSRPFVRRTVAAFREVAAFPSEGGTAPAFVEGIDWSDHWSFAQVDIPALMITDTAPFRYPHYHTPQDTPDKVNYDRLARLTAALEAILRDWAAPSG